MIGRPDISGTGTMAFNATTSAYNFGSSALYNSNKPLSFLTYLRPNGAGENNFGYVFARVLSASASGYRMFVGHNGGSPNFSLGFDSSGVAFAPQRTSDTGYITYGKDYQWLAGSYDGGVLASGIRLYYSKAHQVLREVNYGLATDGSVAPTTASGYSLYVGNRDGSDRTFNGDISYVAIWTARLTLAELEFAKRYGPLSVRRDKLMLCCANGFDYAFNKIPTATTKAVGRGERWRLSGGRPRAWGFFTTATGAYELPIDPLSYSLTLAAPSLVAGRVASIDPLSYALTLADPTLVYGRAVSIDPLTYALTLADPTLEYSGAVAPEELELMNSRIIFVNP